MSAICQATLIFLKKVTPMMRQPRICALTLLAAMLCAAGARAEDDTFTIGGGRIAMKAPAAWDVVEPRFNIIEYEFAIPAAEGDEQPGRVTIMGAGGSVEDNIARWEQQFQANDGAGVKADVDEMKVAGQNVHWVELEGTYLDRPAGPFAGGAAVERANYQMLGAIIMTNGAGNYFIKAYGPARTMTANEDELKAMVESLQVK